MATLNDALTCSNSADVFNSHGTNVSVMHLSGLRFGQTIRWFNDQDYKVDNNPGDYFLPVHFSANASQIL